MARAIPIVTAICFIFVIAALQTLAIPWASGDSDAVVLARDITGRLADRQPLEPRKHKKSKKKKNKVKNKGPVSSKSNGYSPNRFNGNTSSSPTDAFCKEFVSRCYDVALQGKTQGKVQVVHSCKRNGNKYSKSYSFGCKVDGVIRTNDVLGSTEGGFTVTVTTAGATEIITATATQETTVSSTSTKTVLTTETDQHTTSTTTTPVSSVTDTTTTSITVTVPSPVTYTSVTTLTDTLTSTATTTVATSTVTLINTGSGTFTLVQVAIPTNTPIRKRVTDVDASDFCSEFANGCVSVCQQSARSPARHIVCHQDSLSQRTGQAQYLLSCVCLNGKSETQHALAYAAEQKHIATVSTIATQTVTTTLQKTETVPVQVLTTETIVSQVTSTATLTTVSTALRTSVIVSTQTQTTPTTVATTRPTTTSLTTTTTTDSVTATSTTEIILAPTGAVKILDLYTGASYGMVGNPPQYSTLYGGVSSGALHFMAVQDPGGSDLYQLKLTDGSGIVWTAEFLQAFASGSGSFIGSGSGNAAFFESNSGCNSVQAGPPSGQGSFYGAPCETFIFKMQSLDLTSPTPAFNLTGYWQNAADASPSQAKQQYWDYDTEFDVLQFTGDPVKAQTAETGNQKLALTYLRFPVSA